MKVESGKSDESKRIERALEKVKRVHYQNYFAYEIGEEAFNET